MDFSQIKAEAKEAIVGNRMMLFLAILVEMLIVGMLSNFGVGFLVQPILAGGIFILSKKLLESRTFDFNDLFACFKDLTHAAKLLGVSLLTGLIIIGGFILFIIPGIIFAYQYSQAIYVMVENPEMGVWDAMKESKRLMVGHKFEFFIFGLSFIGHILLILITLGIYYIFFAPYLQAAMTNYYLHLRGKGAAVLTNGENTETFQY